MGYEVQRLHPDDLAQLIQGIAAELRKPDRNGVGQYLTVDQVAERLNVSRAYVYRNSSTLGGVKLGEGLRSPLRFRADAVDASVVDIKTTITPRIIRRRSSEVREGVRIISPVLPSD